MPSASARGHFAGILRFVGALGLGWLLLTATRSPAIDAAADVPSFLQANHCYRLTFPIAGSPDWKVLEVLDSGWIRAEVDAGPASARREPAWINTAQVVTVRATPCSE